MKIILNYDFTQQEHAKIMEAGKNRGIDTAYKTTLVGDQLNGCVVFINGSAPENMLEHKLLDGDNIEFVYGFCGG